MKIFIAGMDTETNTFSPIPTGYRSFADHIIMHGDTSAHPANCCSSQMIVWRRRAEERQWGVAESLCVTAEPGGITIGRVYEQFRDQIMADLKAAMPVDAVLLALHGAMVADGYEDCEGDMLRRVREIVGPEVPVGAELDLHCHTTEAMVANATALIAYKEYPHTDIADRAEELFTLIADAAMGQTRPTMAMFDCRMINTYRPTEQPMRGFVDKMIELEGKEGVLAVSLGHCFPWADVPDVGTRMIVVTDNDPQGASALAERLGRELFRMRHEIQPKFMSIDETLDLALAEPEGPVVIADVADNAGGGAPGDSTFLLRRILERGITDVASSSYWDPVAVRFCHEAGVGARLDLRIGGKCGRTSGDPVDFKVTVRGLSTNLVQRFGSVPNMMGEAAWVEALGIALILNTQRTQTFHPDAMTGLGLDPTKRRILVVKSNQHFHAGFAPIAKRILYARGGGAMGMDFAAVPYTKLKTPYWPKVDDPFAS
jgi:microcystin degradation protein MlrC